MKAKLIVDGKEFPIEIQDSELQKLLASRKTGYERVDESQKYWYQASSGNIERKSNMRDNVDAMYYSNANYYSDETIARNNARADNLMRQLRRFAVEHRNKKMNWTNEEMRKYYICTIYGTDELTCDFTYTVRGFSTIYFDTEEVAELAIKTFHDELVWYFTEYKDSL